MCKLLARLDKPLLGLVPETPFSQRGAVKLEVCSHYASGEDDYWSCLFVGWLVCLFVCLFVCLYVCVCVCLFVRSFVRSFVYLFVCLFVCLFVRSFVRLFVCLFACFPWCMVNVSPYHGIQCPYVILCFCSSKPPLDTTYGCFSSNSGSEAGCFIHTFPIISQESWKRNSNRLNFEYDGKDELSRCVGEPFLPQP